MMSDDEIHEQPYEYLKFALKHNISYQFIKSYFLGNTDETGIEVSTYMVLCLS